MNSKIQIEALILSPMEKVWSYWTSADHITKWNFATPDWHCPRATNDLKVGGKYFTRMEAKDGSFAFDFEAIYSEVIPQNRIAYTMPDGRQVVTNFEGRGSGTKVTTTFDAEKQNPEEMQRAGWQFILNNFKKYTEEN